MSKTKVFLISFGIVNLGLRQISSYLKQNEIDVDFIYIKPDTISSFDISGFRQEDIVGVSVVTDHFPFVRKLVGRIRERFGPDSPAIIFGGPHATIMPEQCLKFCDYAVKGEAEETMLAICTNFKDIKSIPGICFFDDGQLVKNPPATLVQDLDKYPIPDYTDYKDLDDYIILASRGCPYSCSYCYNNYLKKLYNGTGRYLRKRGVSSVIAELLAARDASPKLKTISFYDDTLLARNSKELLELFSQYKSEIGLPFFCLASPAQLSEEKIKILAWAGLTRMQIGIQTGSEDINYKVYKRFFPNKTIMECTQLCIKYGISVYFDIIFNNPYETVEDVGRTLNFVLELPLSRKQLHLQGFNLIFYPGTEITENAIRDGYITEKIQENQGSQTTHWVVNSPLFFNSSLDNPLWDIHFSSKDKEHFNTLIALVPYLPKYTIRFLIKHPFSVRFISIILKAFIWLIIKTVLKEDNFVMKFFRKIR